ncbi:NAD(+)/NADH kinase [Natronorubrum sulfidifaciens]|uniref:ATP-NAD/AcoX kinase n=1 Tax=Natronorubrum sulfidifaciens JCM 14089 TaxID=1230460 RepID=L9W5N2_9EURY|nr:NAD(+)/NADH kinase [Natronorubrum sulfidifaciens]ELY44576.1 ATP-NAD/AcoX kinase [Natronorubrum sulfidifaciens JCM 14089]
MDAAWAEAEQPVVGIIERACTDDSDDAGTRLLRVDNGLEGLVSDHGGTIARGTLEDVLETDPSLMVAAGASTLSAIARADPDAPVLPVGDIVGLETVNRDVLPDALAVALAGDATIRQRSVLGVDVDDGTTRDGNNTPARALFDVTLVTDEPARISEYGVSSRGESVATFRADGVVVATPAGSRGYASAVDAPQLSSAVDAVAVTPIAPFVMQTCQWVLPEDELTLTVERNDTPVRLVVDDRPAETVPVDTAVTIAADGALSTLSVPDLESE